jgi:hypothetical protein
VHASHKVLMEADDYILPIVGNQQGILDQQLRPYPFHFVNIIMLIVYIKLHIILIIKKIFFLILPKVRNVNQQKILTFCVSEKRQGREG